MSIIIIRDLSKQAPHSPRARLGGFAIASRTLDKCRSNTAGVLGDYHFDCPLDNQLFSFKGITGEQFTAAVKAAQSDVDVGTWLQTHGTTKTPEEVKAWSDAMEASTLMQVPEKKEFFVAECAKLGLNPETTTTFAWLEADDRATFTAKTA